MENDFPSVSALVKPKVATLGALIKDADHRIRASPSVDLWRQYVARLDAEELMRTALGREFTTADLGTEVEPAVGRRFQAMVRRREGGEPVALIRGFTEFFGLRLAVRRGVFTPRFSSESMAQEAIKRLRARPTPIAVDVACGAGAVALAVASKLPRARVYGLDIAAAAVKLSRENARRLKLPNARFAAGDMLAPLSPKLRGRVDVITIHPPYVSRSQVRTLPREIRDYEPPESLSDRSSDGLGLVRRLAPEAREWLRPGGWLLVEVAPDLARPVARLLLNEGYGDVASKRDSVGATRVVVGRAR
jgi:release factor glutamine methyltransferase